MGLAISMLSSAAQQTPTSPNVFIGGDMSVFSEQANPWGGIDAKGNLTGITEPQLAVDENGDIREIPISPGIAVGDLNGDGLLDLVVADSKGFFWFYPNSGTKTAPKFTTGEIMPIWLGSVRMKDFDFTPGPNRDGAVQNYVPKIQLVDFNGDGKLDLIVGTYPGKLFYIPNMGSASEPKFFTPPDLSQLTFIPLRSDGRLDCNYLSPFLYDWSGSRRLDLIRGDGTYSANSILLNINKGTGSAPAFSEANQIKLIPGMGREHLTPFVFDWNNDGKPDIITGERTGQIEVFLNTSVDADHPSFDAGQKLKFGGQDKFGNFTAVTLAGLTGDAKVPDLIYTNDTGLLYFAHNSGTPGDPKFSTLPQPLKGSNPFPKILVSRNWALGWWNSFHTYSLRGNSEGAPDGVPYELLVVTNAQQEPGFAPPNGVKWKNALKYYVQPHKSLYFPESFYPKPEDDVQSHRILSTSASTLAVDATYQISFWIKGEGVRSLQYDLSGREADPAPETRDYQDHHIGNSISLNSSWYQVTEQISWASSYRQKNVSVGFGFSLKFFGQGTLYLSDVEIHKVP
jgi:hypothetical protein